MDHIAFVGRAPLTYTHPQNLEESREHKLFQTETVDDKSCVKACEKDIKRHLKRQRTINHIGELKQIRTMGPLLFLHAK